MAAAGDYVAGGNESCRVAAPAAEGAASDGGEGWVLSSSHAVAEGSRRLLLFPLLISVDPAPARPWSTSCIGAPLSPPSTPPVGGGDGRIGRRGVQARPAPAQPPAPVEELQRGGVHLLFIVTGIRCACNHV